MNAGEQISILVSVRADRTRVRSARWRCCRAFPGRVRFPGKEVDLCTENLNTGVSGDEVRKRADVHADRFAACGDSFDQGSTAAHMRSSTRSRGSVNALMAAAANRGENRAGYL